MNLFFWERKQAEFRFQREARKSIKEVRSRDIIVTEGGDIWDLEAGVPIYINMYRYYRLDPIFRKLKRWGYTLQGCPFATRWRIGSTVVVGYRFLNR